MGAMSYPNAFLSFFVANEPLTSKCERGGGIVSEMLVKKGKNNDMPLAFVE